MDAHKCRPGAAGADGVERFEFPVRPIDGEGSDRAFFVFAHPIRFIRGIEVGSGGIKHQATRARAHFVDAGGGQGPGAAIRLEEVNAAAISRGQVHLGWQHVAERRTEGTDIGEQRCIGFCRTRGMRAATEGCRPRKRDRGF